MLDQILNEAATEKALEFPDESIRRLYERAKDEQWHLERDVDFDAMDLGRIVAPVRSAMADLYAQAQYGEMVGLAVMTRSVGALPELWAKLFGATQLMDEARHVEFFARAVGGLGGSARVRPGLIALAGEVGTAASPEEIMLGTHVVFETFAQVIFQEGARLSRASASNGVSLPGSAPAARLLDQLEHRVGKDESRHIAFGVLYLKRRFQAMDPAARHRLEDAGARWSGLMLEVISDMAKPLTRLGIAAKGLRDRVQRAQRSHFQTIGMNDLVSAS